MLFAMKQVKLKNGRTAVLRSAGHDDAQGLVDYMHLVYTQTEYLNRYPEEAIDSAAKEALFLSGINQAPASMMVMAVVDGQIAGTCQLAVRELTKLRHRGVVSIALVSDYWGLGLGTALMQELVSAARQQGCTQLELAYAEGNVRAAALYEKMGFKPYGKLPNALALKDGRMLDEVLMVKDLTR